MNGALLLVDELVFPSVDLLTWRALPALLGLIVRVVSLTQEET